MTDVTCILSAIEEGEPRAAERLLPLVYEQLRKLAAHKLAHEKPGQTLQPTALVHEAYLRLVDQDQPQDWDGRGHFFAAAAEAMHESWLRRHRQGSRKTRQPVRRGELNDYPAVDSDDGTGTDAHDGLIALDGALTKLAEENPLAARVIELRRFAGLGHEEVAAASASPFTPRVRNGPMPEPGFGMRSRANNFSRFFDSPRRKRRMEGYTPRSLDRGIEARRDTNPKRKRGIRLRPSHTLRVSVRTDRVAAGPSGELSYASRSHARAGRVSGGH